jgi:glycosyltransferase involved in cell wall biosynthesis
MKGETIVFAAPRTWDSLWRESQQIMSRIAQQNRVFYFEPGRDVSGVTLAELRRTLPSFFSLPVRKEHDNLFIIPTPTTLPVVRQRLPEAVLRKTAPRVYQINNRILTRHIRRVMQAFDIDHPLLWLSSPFNAELAGKFGEKLVCYFNYDDVHDFTQNRRIRDILLQFDDQLSRRADVIFATSRGQCERRKALNPNSHFIPHGVNFELFHSALTLTGSPPADIATIPRPIIGFAGWLGHHIDVRLLVRIAEEFPDCSLVLIGPDELTDSENRKRLLALPNVHFLGRKEPHELPEYLRLFDVALMPWVLTGHIRAAYPMKLHEYLAAGRSAVATNLPELHPFRHVIYVAEDHDEFIRRVGDALHEDDPEMIQTRVGIAQQNTWDHRIAEIYRILHQHLHQQDGSKASKEEHGD